MKTRNPDSNNLQVADLEKLIQVMKTDPLILKKVSELLKLDSFRRRYVLNSWLEQLRQHHAPAKLMRILACLFDDTIADRLSTLITDDHF